MEPIVIRKATVADAEYISLLARVTFTETFGHLFKDLQDLLDYYASTFSEAKIRSSIQKDNNIFWIAFCDELPVGYAKLKIYSPSDFINSPSTSQLQKIYVLKDFLSKKIGHEIQNALFEEVKLLKSRYLWLSVLKANERAISFYRKNGFVEVGEHSFDIGKEHFIFVAMKKDF
jgi:diamine N-acetyltransferase